MVRPRESPDPWDVATWEGGRQANLVAGARLSLPEKLAWIQEVGRLAQAISESRASSQRLDAQSRS